MRGRAVSIRHVSCNELAELFPSDMFHANELAEPIQLTLGKVLSIISSHANNEANTCQNRLGRQGNQLQGDFGMYQLVASFAKKFYATNTLPSSKNVTESIVLNIKTTLTFS
ncbi:hypothetical protein V6N13_119630 [Hibiscus sabdariffa]|uniref:Uncharacterized protein n=1 Tax=Hibiscus sabdariffa TaxID=183260 RepID=A0ABR2E1S7_9ROSI